MAGQISLALWIVFGIAGILWFICHIAYTIGHSDGHMKGYSEGHRSAREIFEKARGK